MGWNNAWYEIRETPSFFYYCSGKIGSTDEWLRVREVVDAYLGRKPRIGNRIGNTKVHLFPLEMANCDFCFFYGVTDNPGMITLLELHPNK